MRWVFACRDCAVVAVRTGSEYLRVVDKIGRRPDDTIVAALAYVGCIDVREVFAWHLRIIVTANAVIGNASVIERRRNPRVRRMTIIAGITAREMCRVFTGGRCAVVAGETRTDDLRVIDGVRRCKGDCIVAIDAQVSGIDVRQVFACGIGAIVAADSISRDVGVIEVGRSPCRGRMAIVTGVAAGKMRRILAGCSHAIVAGEAGTKDLGVIHGIGRRPDDIAVAILTNIGRVDMCQVLARRVRAIVAINALIRDVHVIEIRRNPCR